MFRGKSRLPYPVICFRFNVSSRFFSCAMRNVRSVQIYEHLSQSSQLFVVKRATLKKKKNLSHNGRLHSEDKTVMSS